MIRQRQLPAGNGIVEFDPFATPTPQQQPGDDSPMVIFQKIHRLLRGRYILALSLAVVGAVAGAAGGYLSSSPKWASTGAIRIQRVRQAVVMGENEDDRRFGNMFNDYVNSHINYLQEQKVIDRAMTSPDWMALNRGSGKEAKSAFRKSLKVAEDRDARGYIRVSFLDNDPAAAQIAVREVIDAWMVIFAGDENLMTDERMRQLEKLKRDKEGEITELDARIGNLAPRHGTTDLGSLAQLSTETVRRLTQAESELMAVKNQLALATAARGNNSSPNEGPQKPLVKELDPEAAAFEIARLDPVLAELVRTREQVSMEIKRISLNLSPDHPQVLRLKDRREAMTRQIEERVQAFLAANGGVIPRADGGQGIVPGESVEMLEKRRDALTEARDQIKEKAESIDSTSREIRNLQSAIVKKQDELNEVMQKLSGIRNETTKGTDSKSLGRIAIVSNGDESVLAADSRKKLGALGLLLGGALPICIVMIVGAADRRYRYSEDASTERSQVPLLGILPYLPDSMADPDKAGVAAHCVHQIRTLLQISAVEHDRKVFAITSPTSGDGKTSLCLSLGLSFAASGANTCLIDFDLIGGGLTAAMGARTDVGIIAAIDDGQIDGHVRPTAFPRLSIIPSGRDDAQEVSRLSPKLVRRLIDDARKSFDVVVIDTGPILGSIEATLVCGIVDGVVLALGRGQQKSMANRAIDTLRSVQAHVMGVVFNRAQPNDFKRSVSQSVRSVPAQEAGNSTTLKALPAIGPMARTVASHIRPDA